MSKILISSIASVGIISRATNPAEIFIEVKDDGHPIKLVRRQLCLIGGNWIGDEAKQDTGTLDTFRRELNEELSFDRPIRDSVELNLLGMSDIGSFAPVPQPNIRVTTKDMEMLGHVKKTIAESAMPFGDFLNTVSKAAIDAADPTNTRDGFTYLASCWTVPIQEDTWKCLLYLQRRFKNLSSESRTLVTSLREIIHAGTKIAFAYDRVLQQFFKLNGLADANNIPLVPDMESERVHMPLPTYHNYLMQYEIAKKPV